MPSADDSRGLPPLPKAFFAVLYALGWLRAVLLLGGLGLFSVVVGNTTGRVIGVVLVAVCVAIGYSGVRAAWQFETWFPPR